MSFDVNEYFKVMDEFLVKMGNVYDLESPDISGVISDICHFLRIAELSVVFCNTSGYSFMDKDAELTFYSEGNPDHSHSVRFDENAVGDVSAVFYAYQQSGAPDWTETEKEKILIFEKTFSAFSGRMHLEKIAEHLTLYDRDFGMHNTTFFLKTAGMLIEQGKIGEYCACRFNIRRFSIINRMIGWQKGTAVLKAFVNGLQKLLGEEEYVCRMYGDNFAVLFLKSHLDMVVDYLVGTEIDAGEDGKLLVSAYAGYYMIPPDCQMPPDVMDNAGAAESTAKYVLKTEYVFFDDNLQQRRDNVKLLENVFATSLRNGEFRVYYQPKVYLKNYRLHGAEALCRWFHYGEIVPPARFVPTLEQSNNICLLDLYMLEQVCCDIRRWLDKGMAVVRVSVNLSRRHLEDADLLDKIVSVIDKYHVPHEYIEIELTETTTDVDFSKLKKIVTGLRQEGISTSVDDFGIGYSSLSLIKELPWNVLKIDKSFLPGERHSSSLKYAMLKHLIALAQDMGLECIVEGVETSEQVRLLKENNCFLAQGFYFDMPLPVEEYEKRLVDLANAE